MHSKWQIWDFFSTYNRDTLKSYEGVLAINTFDPICLKLVKDFLTSHLSEVVLHYKTGQEISSNWLQDEFQTLSLFGNKDSFFIHHAHDLSADILDSINKLEIQDRFLILSFENEQATWKKLIKDGKISTLIIEPPRFWEFNKLLDFVCMHLKLPLSYDAKSWILDALENNLSTFYNAGSLIKLNYPDLKEISLIEVKELLTIEKLDQFQLASLLARKKHKDFFEKLVQLEGDFEKMRNFFLFMQSHFIKIADTSYLTQKTRLTQYDKDLQNASKLWKEADLFKIIEQFNHWEILAKKKDPFLWHEMKRALLRVISH